LCEWDVFRISYSPFRTLLWINKIVWNPINSCIAKQNIITVCMYSRYITFNIRIWNDLYLQDEKILYLDTYVGSMPCALRQVQTYAAHFCTCQSAHGIGPTYVSKYRISSSCTFCVRRRIWCSSTKTGGWFSQFQGGVTKFEREFQILSRISAGSALFANTGHAGQYI